MFELDFQFFDQQAVGLYSVHDHLRHETMVFGKPPPKCFGQFILFPDQ